MNEEIGCEHPRTGGPTVEYQHVLNWPLQLRTICRLKVAELYGIPESEIPEESLRRYERAALATTALTEEEFRQWVRTPNDFLDGRTPLESLRIDDTVAHQLEASLYFSGTKPWVFFASNHDLQFPLVPVEVDLIRVILQNGVPESAGLKFGEPSKPAQKSLARKKRKTKKAAETARETQEPIEPVRERNESDVWGDHQFTVRGTFQWPVQLRTISKERVLKLYGLMETELRSPLLVYEQIALATTVYDPQQFRDWLGRPNRWYDWAKPMDLIRSGHGDYIALMFHQRLAGCNAQHWMDLAWWKQLPFPLAEREVDVLHAYLASGPRRPRMTR